MIVINRCVEHGLPSFPCPCSLACNLMYIIAVDSVEGDKNTTANEHHRLGSFRPSVSDGCVKFS